MQHPYIKFLIQLSFFSLALLVLAIVLYNILPEQYSLAIFPYIFLFNVVFTAVFHWVIINHNPNKPMSFGNRFMLMTTIKLLLYITFLGAYVFNQPSHALVFTLTFLLLYICFTVFEVITAIKSVQKKH